jgi:hypothetical protein
MVKRQLRENKNVDKLDEAKVLCRNQLTNTSIKLSPTLCLTRTSMLFSFSESLDRSMQANLLGPLTMAGSESVRINQSRQQLQSEASQSLQALHLCG